METYLDPSTQSAAAELLHYIHHQATGRLIVVHKSTQYYFDLFQGQIATAVSSVHRRRRWQRAVQQQVPQLQHHLEPKATQQNWERSHLHHGVSEGWLTCNQAKAILRDCTREVLFSLTHVSKYKLYWQASNSNLCPRWTLSRRILESLYEEVQELSANWQELGLKPQWVYHAFQLDQSLDLRANVFSNLTACLDGTHSFWDLTSDLSVSRATVSRILHHFLEQGIVQRRPLADLPAEEPPQPSLAETMELDGHISYIPEMVLA
ncbi:hypothetical protein E1H12_01205 [Geitlerinema sp. P-1104]|uniref:hypothetical protein n=1 Tax=Geitlerinema sp. P-1104 TaxID=2546230 RepID=UPI0014775166|nr:hypothetical protein [Geitlerinema sp. P-1104]NMG57170.1 hypothetical protein [Geitlerinema sp. P-1104]